jgi:hypothetical protein
MRCEALLAVASGELGTAWIGGARSQMAPPIEESAPDIAGVELRFEREQDAGRSTSGVRNCQPLPGSKRGDLKNLFS